MSTSNLAIIAAVFAVTLGPANSVTTTVAPMQVKLVLECNVTQGTAAIFAEADCDQKLQQIVVRDPSGADVFKSWVAGERGLGLQGFKFETSEGTAAEVLANYPEGNYLIQARTTTTSGALGTAYLSHRILRPVTITYPLNGAVNVPSTGLVLTWTPTADAAGYQIILEQGDSDGLKIDMPPGCHSLTVPDGFLRSRTHTTFEVMAEAQNGNRTAIEVEFTTL
ncbi:MAG: hypothetical protein JNL28_07595 [Planctomycetes bacterium]|nr:hypothetical protein [Planctomycetota bacterium]